MEKCKYILMMKALKLQMVEEREKHQRDRLNYENNKTKREQLTQSLNDLTASLNLLPDYECEQLLSLKEKEQVIKTLSRLKNLKLVSLPVHSSTEIKTFFKNKEEHDKKALLLQQLEAIPPILYEPTLEDIKKMTQYQKEVHLYNVKTNMLKEQKASLVQQLSTLVIEEVEDVEEVRNHIAHIQLQLEKSKLAHEMIEQHTALANAREEVLTLTHRVENLLTLKEHASEIECKILENVVNTISTHIFDVCQTMFEQEIKVELGLYKKLKVSSRVKPEVHFSIIYKGGKYDSIAELSGGESDRTSLALTLALNRISSGHLVMFDESLKTLDPELKTDVIKTIQENVTNTVLIVDHDGLEGIFDHVIDVDLL